MTAQLFRAHGKFCASHPWEVIVALLTLTACMLTVDRSKSPVPPSRLHNCQGWRESCEGLEAEYVAVDTILMTVIRCSAILYSYYQFLYLNKFGSKYILSKCSNFIINPTYILRLPARFTYLFIQSCVLCQNARARAHQLENQFHVTELILNSFFFLFGLAFIK